MAIIRELRCAAEGKVNLGMSKVLRDAGNPPPGGFIFLNDYLVAKCALGGRVDKSPAGSSSLTFLRDSPPRRLSPRCTMLCRDGVLPEFFTWILYVRRGKVQSNVGEEDPEPKVSIGGAHPRSPGSEDTPTETKMLAESTC